MLVEKKLRDLTEQEYHDWYENNCSKISCRDCPFKEVHCGRLDVNVWIKTKELFNNKFLDRLVKVNVPDVLDKDEKEYLSYVINPFKHRIEYIRKFKSGNGYCISIKMIDGDFMYFPNYVNPNMYAGLLLDKKYTLKELGL